MNCKCEWCDRKIYCKGYCKRHYQQVINFGECKRTRIDRNEYIIYEDYAEIILYNSNNEEKSRCIIDLDDVERCKPYKWTLRNDGYVSAKINNKGVKLHRFIVNTPKGLHTDHENRNRLDYRKNNLKICTQEENNKNKGIYNTNKSGYTGVKRANTISERYSAEIKIKGKTIHLGRFHTYEEAVKARQNAEIKYYGKILKN